MEHPILQPSPEFCHLSYLDPNISLSTLSTDTQILVFPYRDRPTFVQINKIRQVKHFYILIVTLCAGPSGRAV
jgi:hypothetical protein